MQKLINVETVPIETYKNQYNFQLVNLKLLIRTEKFLVVLHNYFKETFHIIKN